MNEKKIDVVFIVPKRKESILLFRNKKSGYWELPAGHPNETENVIEAARRICFKLTCFEVIEEVLIGEKEATFEGRRKVMTMAYYLGVIKESSKVMKSSLFDMYLEYDEDSPPNPICNTCKLILSEYKKLEELSTS